MIPRRLAVPPIAAAGASGPALDALFAAAYTAAKRIRSETGLAERPVTMAAAALRVARDIHGDVARSSALLIGDGEMGLNPGGNPIRAAIIVWQWGRYLGEEGLERGIRAKVSSFNRHFVNSKMTKGKTCGDYVNSILAKREALLDGYDEAILLDTQGLVSEASGENVFVVRGGALHTPALPTILDGITRASVIEIARDKGIPVHERPLTRDELYIADELFLTGTAAEVTPIREVDRRRIGEGRRGPVTRALQATFFDVVTGREPKYERWLHYV